MKVVSSILITLLLISLGADPAAPQLRFSPTEGLMNAPVSIEASGLRPGSRITVTARMTMFGNWRSHATFVVDQTGRVRLDRDAPVDGTYTGIDGMGLFWATVPEPAADGAPPPPPPDVRAPVLTTFDIEAEGRTIASATYKRWWVRPDVRITDVRTDGLIGKFFEPQTTGRPHPAILVLSGSEGGTNDYAAAGLAAKGYAALALAYFRRRPAREGDSDSLPNELVNIPLEYFLKATDWLQHQKSVDPRRLAIFGGSRGAEAALLVASIDPRYRVVIAYAPTSVSAAGIGKQNADKPSWTYRGEPIPFAPNNLTVAALRAGIDPAHGSIPIERSHAAIFLASAGDDWISRGRAATVMGDLLIDRLKQFRYPYPYQHLSYAHAGHMFGMFFLPGPILAEGGGTPRANAAAGADSTPRMLAFLKQNLSKR
jgi:dienelactone hydrolase